MTPQQASNWVALRQWDNGCSLIPDPTVDAIQFAEQYSRNADLWNRLFSFLATADLAALQPGKIVLVPGRLWINVLEYTPKSAADTKIESHRNMIDLQYTFQGSELMGLASSVITTEPYNPDKDVEKYRSDDPVAYVPSDPSRFFIYFPSDMHQPSVRACDNPGVSRKIVGKIEYAR